MSYKVVGKGGKTDKPYELSRCCCMSDDVWLVVPVDLKSTIDQEQVAVAICGNKQTAEFLCQAMNDREG